MKTNDFDVAALVAEIDREWKEKIATVKVGDRVRYTGDDVDGMFSGKRMMTKGNVYTVLAIDPRECGSLVVQYDFNDGGKFWINPNNFEKVDNVDEIRVTGHLDPKHGHEPETCVECYEAEQSMLHEYFMEAHDA